MDKKCFKCGSDQIVAIVPAVSALIPEVKADIMTGKAEIACCRTNFATGSRYKCKNCGFEWDSYYEIAQERESHIKKK